MPKSDPSEEISIWNTPVANKEKPLLKPDDDQDDNINSLIIYELFNIANKNEGLEGLLPPFYKMTKMYSNFFNSPEILEAMKKSEDILIQDDLVSCPNYFSDEEKELLDCLKKETRILLIKITMFMLMIDPLRKKHPHASLVVAGKLSGHPYYQSKEFNAALGFSIESEILLGKSNVARDIAALSNTPLIHNRSSACLSALGSFMEMTDRPPTKKELETVAVQKFPDLFLNMDAKEWRRLRKVLSFEWLEDGKRGVKKGGKFK